MEKILEICCGELAAVQAALEGGASRIELCSGLEEGGMTPSLGLVKAAVATGIKEVNVLIRPRSGDFLYSGGDILAMEEDIRMVVAAGASGVVIGALDCRGDVDIPLCRRLIEAAREASGKAGGPHITFHRAFDVCRDPFRSLEAIMDLGCDSLLTSGCQPDACRGIPLLKKLVERAAGGIGIIAGSGVNPANAARILASTGVDGLHSTARTMSRTRMRFLSPHVSFGENRLSTDPAAVEALRAIVSEGVAKPPSNGRDMPSACLQ